MMKNKLAIFLLALFPVLLLAQNTSDNSRKNNEPIVVLIHRLTDIKELSSSQKQILKDQLQNQNNFEMYFKGNAISSIPDDLIVNFTNIGRKIMYNVKTALKYESYDTYQRINFPLLEYRLPCILEVKGYTSRTFKEKMKNNVIAENTKYVYSHTPTIYLKMWEDEIGDPHFYGELVVFPEEK
ncbi:hypothetical protein [Chryseobacterium piperi]|nr:hypothetical protein [Chryseobacterium piperi]